MIIPRDQGFRGIFIFSRFPGVVYEQSFAYLLRMKLFSRIFIATVASAVLLACAEHNIPIEAQCLSSEEISFSGDVEPIIETVCAISGCHNGTLGADRNWLILSSLQAKAGEARRRITLPQDHPDHMPRSGSLTAEEIQTIICWVDQGAQDN